MSSKRSGRYGPLQARRSAAARIVRCLCVVAATVGGALAAGPAGAAVLFSDTFDRPDNANIDASTTGMGGTLMLTPPLDAGDGNWDEAESAQILGSKLRLNGSSAWAVPQHSFTDTAITSAGGFVVEFDLSPAAGNSTSNWGALTFGSSEGQAERSYAVVNSGDKPFSILFREYGKFDAFRTGSSALAGEVVFDSSPTTGETWHIELTVSTTSFTVGQYGTVQVAVTGELDGIAGTETKILEIDPNNQDVGGSNGDKNSYRFKWITADNFLTLEEGVGRNFDFDNFSVSPIPEPATLALMAVGGAGLVMLRRKRR